MTENESVREGGEKYFISKMIDDEDRGRQILLNTCLVGKASTYREFVEQILPKKLQEKRIAAFTSTIFNAKGRTVRSALAWTYDERFKFT